MNKFVLKMFKWVDGALQATRHEFISIEEAVDHAIDNAAHGYKIYDHRGNLFHADNNPKDNTYA
jgi:hypothetical protein